MEHLLWNGSFVYNDDLRGTGRDNYTLCRAYGIGAVTTCFDDWDRSRTGFEHPTYRLRGECSNPLRLFLVITSKIFSLLRHNTTWINLSWIPIRFCIDMSPIDAPSFIFKIYGEVSMIKLFETFYWNQFRKCLNS